MKNTTDFETADFIQYMSLDVMDELNELEEYIDNKDAENIRKQYNHCNSLLTGIKYALIYIADEETQKVLEHAVDNMRKLLESRRQICKKIIDEQKESTQIA